MPTLKVEAKLSFDDLLNAAEQLSLDQLERFKSQVLALTAQRKAPNLPKDEADLLLRINQGVSADMQKRYGELIAARKAETLTQYEHADLLRLTDQIEKHDAKRMEDMAELARLRKTSLTALMQELDIQPSCDG